MGLNDNVGIAAAANAADVGAGLDLQDQGSDQVDNHPEGVTTWEMVSW